MKNPAVSAAQAAAESNEHFMLSIKHGRHAQVAAAESIEASRAASGGKTTAKTAELRDSLILGLRASLMGIESYRAWLTDPDEIAKLDAELEMAKQALAELEEQ